MDLSKLPIKPAKRNPVTDPREIFKSLTLRGSIQNIWEPQAEALNAWNQNRDTSDTVIQMNTGGGKTLVGLLIAQSLVNETKGKVLYVCPTNQLVEQVEAKAAECGISVATYKNSKWSHESTYYTSHILKIAPEMTLISVGSNVWDLPDNKAVELYMKYSSGSNRGNKIYRTDEMGNIRLVLKSAGGWTLTGNQ